jgi:hypothetical protein
MRCIAYDFQGGFENNSFNHKDEEVKEVPNIKDQKLSLLFPSFMFLFFLLPSMMV